MKYTTTLTDAEVRHYSNLEFENHCYKRMAKISSRERTRQRKIRESQNTVLKGIIIITLLVCGMRLFVDNIELFSANHRVALMHEVMAGNEESIEIFEKYIDRDIYLFNGPTTLKAMADKYNLDARELSSQYYESGYETVQEFFNKVVKPAVK